MRKEILIFSGPTITEVEAQPLLGAVYLPPAKQGDLYAAYVEYKPKIIGLIDGFFENTASPWHKEILYIMDQGCHVYGASSMGALRAAELYDFGMVGIGKIFEAYKQETITNDDEVAVLHGPELLGYPNLSIAMVNIRATLEKARLEGIITKAFESSLIHKAKTLFYKKRNFSSIMSELSENPDYEGQKELLSSWLENYYIDQKKEDAFLLLQTIKDIDLKKLSSKKVEYVFEKTLVWKQMQKQIHMSTQNNKNSIHLDYLRSCNFLKDLSKDLLQSLSANMIAKTFSKGQSIFDKGDDPDGLYAIKSGHVHVYSISEEGKQIVFDILGPNQTFGEIGLFDGSPRTACVAAAQDCEVLFLSSHKWTRISENVSRDDWVSITKNICALTRKTSSSFEAEILMSGQARLLRKLCTFIQEKKFLQIIDKKYVIEISQENLAKTLGLSREMTNKILSTLEKNEILKTEHRKIIIPDLEKLETILKEETGYDHSLLDVA